MHVADRNKNQTKDQQVHRQKEEPCDQVLLDNDSITNY